MTLLYLHKNLTYADMNTSETFSDEVSMTAGFQTNIHTEEYVIIQTDFEMDVRKFLPRSRL